MSREKIPIPQEALPEDEGEVYNPTPEEIKMALEMSGKKVKRVMTEEDRAREKKAADEALEAAHRKIFGETRKGQREIPLE